MHSSRMRTGRSLTVCCSLLPGGVSLVPGGGGRGEGFSLVPGGVSLVPGGVLPAGGFSLVLGGVLLGPGGCLLGPRGVLPARRVLPAGGVSAWSRGGSLETPPVNRITHTCKNITLATTSLRPVISWNRFPVLPTRCHWQ